MLPIPPHRAHGQLVCGAPGQRGKAKSLRDCTVVSVVNGTDGVVSYTTCATGLLQTLAGAAVSQFQLDLYAKPQQGARMAPGLSNDLSTDPGRKRKISGTWAGPALRAMRKHHCLKSDCRWGPGRGCSWQRQGRWNQAARHQLTPLCPAKLSACRRLLPAVPQGTRGGQGAQVPQAQSRGALTPCPGEEEQEGPGGQRGHNESSKKR